MKRLQQKKAFLWFVTETLQRIPGDMKRSDFIILLFIVFKLLIRLLSKVILKLFELPVIRVVNRLLGGAFGLCEGLLLIYAAILVIRIIYPFIENPLITEEMINSSFLFKSIYNLGFTTLISDVINSGII